MAWSWSHSSEAYSYARCELDDFSRPLLLEILTEWRMHEKGRPDQMWADTWPKELAMVTFQNRETRTQALRDAVWEKAREQATCDNGGYNAWMCPYGCHPHCVDFGPSDSLESPRMTRADYVPGQVFI